MATVRWMNARGNVQSGGTPLHAVLVQSTKLVEGTRHSRMCTFRSQQWHHDIKCYHFTYFTVHNRVEEVSKSFLLNLRWSRQQCTKQPALYLSVSSLCTQDTWPQVLLLRSEAYSIALGCTECADAPLCSVLLPAAIPCFLFQCTKFPKSVLDLLWSWMHSKLALCAPVWNKGCIYERFISPC